MEQSPAITSPPDHVSASVDVRPVPRSRRSDWTTTRPLSTALAIHEPTFVEQLRTVFDALDREVDAYADDPIATGQALARIETLLGDVRYLRDRLRRATAQALHDYDVRRLTIEGVTTLEATSEVQRTDWRDRDLLVDMLRLEYGTDRFVNPEMGDIIGVDDLAGQVLAWVRVEWRLTQIRVAGLDPDRYCVMARDDDGKPLRSPSLRIVDNRVKGRR